MADVGADPELVRATERWFLHRGLPHLIEGYRATQDVFTRSVGLLLFVALVEVLNAPRLEWEWWQNTLALLGGGALLVAAYGLVNALRHRPAWQRPDDVGPVELAVFVLLPPSIAAVFGQLGTAAVTVAVNVVLLGLVYLATSYGLVPMTRWALGRTVAALETIADLIGRALPLLFALTILVFVNTEAWQVAAALPGPLFALTGAMFVVVGLFFLLTRLPGEVRRVDQELGDGGLAEACRGTPVEDVAASVPSSSSLEPPELTGRQKLNVYLVFLFAQAVQAALVTAAVFAFFTLFGMVAIRPEVVDDWLGSAIENNSVWSFSLFGQPMEMTTALLHVSGFVAFVAGFSFTVSLVTDSGYREEFFDEVVGDVRQALAVRTVYLALRSST